MTPKVEDLFQRSLTAHLPPDSFGRLRGASVLIAGLGGGSNIAELLVRKGVGRMTIADLDVYEPHNIRQRGSLASSWGSEKTSVMAGRLKDINPHLDLTCVREGITVGNAPDLVRRADVVVDMLDFHALGEKVALCRAARVEGKCVVTTPSVVNGAVLYVFTPESPSFEEFFGYEVGMPPGELALRFLKRLIPHFPPEAPEALYRAAALGERTIPLDAVGVDQASVLASAAVENLLLGRQERIVAVPRGIQADLSDPSFLARIVDFSDGELRLR
ncbi:MAG TPA: ThiF family adenylyltransferase [Planctomycetota bacterium]|nr:ThiF family adenylyltransferase [Planctomycetota bacterium]